MKSEEGMLYVPDAPWLPVFDASAKVRPMVQSATDATLCEAQPHMSSILNTSDGFPGCLFGLAWMMQGSQPERLHSNPEEARDPQARHPRFAFKVEAPQKERGQLTPEEKLGLRLTLL